MEQAWKYFLEFPQWNLDDQFLISPFIEIVVSTLMVVYISILIVVACLRSSPLKCFAFIAV